jgi:hypothetical protein
VEQGHDIRELADLAAERIRADLLLKDGSHPFERDLPSLLSPIGTRGDPSFPSGIAEKLLRALGGYNRRVSTGQQEKEVDCVLLLQRDQEVVYVLPKTVPIARNWPHIVLHGAVTTAEAFLITNAFVDSLDREPG